LDLLSKFRVYLVGESFLLGMKRFPLLFFLKLEIRIPFVFLDNFFTSKIVLISPFLSKLRELESILLFSVLFNRLGFLGIYENFFL
jgi:hypothetical protein